MSNHEEVSYEDTCAWCKHPLKVYVLSWQTVKSRDAMPLVANYCNEKTRQEQGEYTCEEEALSTPENVEAVLLEIVRRRRKIERLEKEAMEAARGTAEV
jgi:hypothetical protein